MPLLRKATDGRNSDRDVFGMVHPSSIYYHFIDSIIDAGQISQTRKDTRMVTKTSISDIDAQIEKLRDRRRTLIVKSAERIARAATKSGLAEMEITDEELDAVFGEIAARFRKGEKEGAFGSTASPRRPASGGSGTTAEVSHDE